MTELSDHEQRGTALTAARGLTGGGNNMVRSVWLFAAVVLLA